MSKKKTYEYNGIIFDSKEELEFYHWLIEAKEVGYVETFDYQKPELELIPKKTYPVKKELKTKTKIVEKHLLHPFRYTGDYRIKFTEQFFKDFPDCGLKRLHTYYPDGHDPMHDVEMLWIHADVKGQYNLKNHHRIFSLTQKVVYDKTGYYINMIVPEKFFNKTWVPKKAAYKKKGVGRIKAYRGAKLINEILRFKADNTGRSEGFMNALNELDNYYKINRRQN